MSALLMDSLFIILWTYFSIGIGVLLAVMSYIRDHEQLRHLEVFEYCFIIVMWPAVVLS